MKIQKLINKADSDVFDEIIKACEGKMVSPFKKEKMVVEVEGDEEPEEMEAEEMSSDMDPEEIEKLMELYRSIKGE